jgi:hypothetical protein
MALAPKAKLVSARELPSLVTEAVRAAAANPKLKGKIDLADPTITIRWELIGRILRDLADAQTFSADVAKSLKAKSITVTPATLIIDKRILAGFFEKVQVPIERQF